MLGTMNVPEACDEIKHAAPRWKQSIRSTGMTFVRAKIRKEPCFRSQATASSALGLFGLASALACAGASAPADQHWAYQSPICPPVPIASSASASNPIDRFLLLALKRKGLTFSAPADRRTLLRRVTFDLIGLPPTPREMDAFLADRTPNAYEKVVDRLLADPRFGEKWARHWLDTAGYADSEGILQEDKIRPNAWRYRDYVIRSFNADKPYDRFLREQIAGDELVDFHGAPKWTPEIEEAVTATGFLRTAVDATRDDFNAHQFTEYQVRMLNDTQTILVSSTLGITLQCARCHDHKYEPLTQRDYYRMQAFLAGGVRPDGKLLPTNRRQILAATDAEQARAKATNAAVDAAIQALSAREAALMADFRKRSLAGNLAGIPEADRAAVVLAAGIAEAQRTPEQKALLAKYKAQIELSAQALSAAFPEFKTAHAEIAAARAAEEQKRVLAAEIRGFYDQDSTPPATPVRIRGEWSHPGDAVEPGVPGVLDSARSPFRLPAPATGATTTGRRRALAEWIVRPDNPLTARVIVNRLWSHHFGVGLVATPDNFGKSGAKPANQPLLDWLACSLTRGIDGQSPWTLKALHRLMVTSSAYRQGSALRPLAAKIDPDDRLLWRQRPRRLEAENIRDSILYVAGALDAKMYGDPVLEETRPTGEIVPANEAGPGRRSVYLLVRRSMPVTFLNTFDAPIMETNCTRRVTSSTATQALALMNSGFVDAQARTFAARVLRETAPGAATPGSTATAGPSQPPDGAPAAAGARLSAYITTAYRIALARTPTPQERNVALAFLRAQTARYAQPGKPESPAEQKALGDFCLALLGSNEFVYVD